ncbi:Thioredoxin [Candidatus Gugararchaeum adminiculabundum]|nr:Thioredoxin [Candidatus Gugararchaeum adminiculabundum]
MLSGGCTQKKLLIVALLAVGLLVFGCLDNGQPPAGNNSSSKYSEGNASAAIIVTVYSDFQCPFCGVSEPQENKFLQDHSAEVKMEFRNFPLGMECNSLLQYEMHPFACKAAEAAECAADQKKFWEYHHMLFANQGNLGTADLKKYAADLGLDSAQFDQCLDSGVKSEAVKKDIAQGIVLGIDSTPTIFMNGKKVEFSRIDQVYAALDSALADAKKGN